jgi:hypothetical protein
VVPGKLSRVRRFAPIEIVRVERFAPIEIVVGNVNELYDVQT